jgi:hypothetical protein
VLPGGPRRLSGPPDRRKSRLMAGALTVAVHVIVFVALFWPRVAGEPAGDTQAHAARSARTGDAPT